jgi:branched-chain amino acid transport system substrate-binding protein
VIFYGGMDAVAGPMLKQMKALGIAREVRLGRRRLLGKAAAAGRRRARRRQGDLRGGRRRHGRRGSGHAAFTERYRQRFKIPLQTYAPYAYDA